MTTNYAPQIARLEQELAEIQQTTPDTPAHEAALQARATSVQRSLRWYRARQGPAARPVSRRAQTKLSEACW